MIDFLLNLIKKQPIHKHPVNFKPNSKNDLVSPDSISLNEKVIGNVYCLKEVTVDKNGDITGDINSISCIVNGRVNGNILSEEYIEVKNTAIIEGNIKSCSIEIEAGSIINGFISIEKKIKLPAIIKKMELAMGLENSIKDTSVTVKSIPLTAEIEIPEIIQEPERKLMEPDKKSEIIQKSPPKVSTNNPNDNWW